MSVIELGFAIADGVFSEHECEEMCNAISESEIAHSRAGARHLMSLPSVKTLAADARLIDLASKWLGSGAIPFRATLFEKSAQTNWLIPWHQDTALPLESKIDDAGWGPWSEKGGVLYAHAPAWALNRVIALRVHLDASTAENGPLRVIAGSHLSGVLTDGEVQDHVRGRESTDCLTPRGGVIAMRPLIVHSSSKVQNEEPRRVLHIEYCDSLELGGKVRLAFV